MLIDDTIEDLQQVIHRKFESETLYKTTSHLSMETYADEHPCGMVPTLETCDDDRKCTYWLRDSEKTVESEESGSVFSESTENSAMDSGFVFTEEGIVLDGKMCFQNGVSPLHLDVPLQKSSKKLCESVNMYKCKKVHIGDVMIVNGPLIVNNNEEENMKMLQDSAEVDYNVITRINWLAQPALGGKELLDGPANYVIIYHTATEEGFTQAKNTLLVRLIQTFHIKSRNWSDIAYNFLVGSDGQIYEGRGWGVVPARLHNQQAIAIAFIGCFLEHLPPSLSLNRAKGLIKYGVKKEHISKDYRLLSHRQCAPVESPGRRLYEEVKTWDHWDESVDVNHPAFVMDTEIQHVDFVNRLEAASYQFEHKVDPPSGNDFGHEDRRVGDVVEGKYYLLLPDDRRQTVECSADKDEYQPKITYEEVGGGYPSGGSNGGTNARNDLSA